MLIGVEVTSAVVGRRSGVGQYTDNLLRELAQQASISHEAEFIYYANKYAPVVDETGPSLRAENIYTGYQISPRLLWLQGGLRRSIAATRPDLCHFPNYLTPLGKIASPFVVTMYDMSVYLTPEYHPTKTVLVHKAIMPHAARHARQIITISESARQDILHFMEVPAEKVRVVYAGVDKLFQITPDAEAETRVRQEYKLDFPFILSVGTLEPRKNHVRLIEAFNQLVKQERIPHHLVMVGGYGWKGSPIAEVVQRCGLTDRIHFLGYVPRQDLPALYRLADVFAFASLQEGFGLPVLEAMACATPVLTSTDPALLEISGGAAINVDPLSVNAIAKGLHSILTDSQQATTLRRLGVQRAKMFSWEKAARETLQVYADALDQPTKPDFYFSADAGTIYEPLPTTYHLPPTTYYLPPTDALPTTLEQAILQTVLYADVFTYPLTLPELQRYLIGFTASLDEIKQRLVNSDELNYRLEQRSGYVFLKGRDETVARRERQAGDARRGRKMARRWAKWLQAVPFLETALLTGGLAVNSSRHHDDIDLLLLTRPGRLWTCRALIILLVRLARLQGVELCPNYLLAITDSALTLDEHNLYTAHELAQMQLLFGKAGHNRLLKLNPWLTDFLPNAVHQTQNAQPQLRGRGNGLARAVRWLGEKALSGKWGDKFERWESQRKIARFARQSDSHEVYFSPEVCKGHFGSYSRQTLQAFNERCQHFLTSVTQP